MNLRAVQYGDVISVERMFYSHFGVYSGNHRVIHYVKVSSFCEGEIRETSLEYFLDGADTFKIHHFPTTKAGLIALLQLKNAESLSLAKIFDIEHISNYHLYSPAETVRRARSQIGKKGYSLLFHNCEHVAIWCKTGVEQSKQVESFGSGLLDWLNPFA